MRRLLRRRMTYDRCVERLRARRRLRRRETVFHEWFGLIDTTFPLAGSPLRCRMAAFSYV